MKPFFIKVAIGIVLVLSGWKIAEHGDKVLSKKRLQEYKDLCDNSATTFGFPQDSVSVLTFKLKSTRTETYTIGYAFNVSDRQYVSSITSNVLAVKDSVRIWYDKKNPASNSTSDPCVNLQNILKIKSTGSQWPYYLIGVLMILFGASLAWGTIKNKIRAATKSKN